MVATSPSEPWRKLTHQGRVTVKTLQLVDEVVLSVNVVQSVGDQQALHNAALPGAQLSQLNSWVFLPFTALVRGNLALLVLGRDNAAQESVTFTPSTALTS
jgi:hypothetical protein